MRLAHQTLGTMAAVLTIAAAVASGCKDKKIAAPPSVDANKLVIVKAEWGALQSSEMADVTKVLAGMVKDNALRVEAVAEILGDPAKTKLKQLHVEWSKGGVQARKRILEGGTLLIGADEKPIPARLVVRKAVYGNFTSGKTTDVTKMVEDMAETNFLKVTPTNATFGDPAEGQVKQLRLDYTFDGVAKSKITDENQPLVISETGQ